MNHIILLAVIFIVLNIAYLMELAWTMFDHQSVLIIPDYWVVKVTVILWITLEITHSLILILKLHD